MIVLFRTFLNMFRIEDLRNKIGMTLFVVAIFRLGHFITLPSINSKFLLNLMSTSASGGMFSFMDMISGGGMAKGSLFALGVGPYITASIMVQFLSNGIPYLEALAKEGEAGRKILKQITRYVAVVMSFLYASTAVVVLEMSGSGALFVKSGLMVRLESIFLMAIGAIFCMWLGEQISRYGIGQGSSMLIFASAVASIPSAITRMWNGYSRGEFELWLLLGLLLVSIALVAIVIFVERGERRVVVQYAKRVVGKQVFGGVSSYIPFKINSSSIMPIIMSGNLLTMVSMLLKPISKYLITIPFLSSFDPSSWFFNFLFACLIVVMTYVYTAIMYDPAKLADNLRKSGAVVPGIRPGPRTADFLNSVLTRISLPGAIYIASLAVLPQMAIKALSLPIYAQGTTLLIVVGVAMDTFAQIESYLIEQKYSGFLDSKSVRLRGRRV